jgi:hypothetical protein
VVPRGAPRWPGPEFNERALDVEVRAPGTEVYRIAPPKYSGAPAPYWPRPDAPDPAGHRFHSPGELYRVAYFGLSEQAAFAESWLRSERPTPISADPNIGVATFQLPRRISLVRLIGSGLSKAGATTGSITGAYNVSGAWGEAVHGHPDGFDGIVYPSTRDSSMQCAALFDRAGLVDLRPTRYQKLLADDPPLSGWIRKYGIPKLER